MEYAAVINELSRNQVVFEGLFMGLKQPEILWKPHRDKWCLLEVVCHLYDEEREDFRARIRHVFEHPTQEMPSINPPQWVEDRKYIEQNYADRVSKFITERQQSLEWLRLLKSPKWINAYKHPKFGDMTAQMFLANWVAHDYLHIRQILGLKFGYLQQQTNESLTYAGSW